MRPDLLHLASDLARRSEPFVLATVVRREPPSSARAGDTALVTQGGAFHGWLGASCTMGDGDEAAVRAALDLDPGYLGLVGSRRRFAAIRETLAGGGTPADALGRVKCPAGLDIGAHSPAEIAVSIMAELVQRVHASLEPARTRALPVAPGEARDPVCGMMVAVPTARHMATHAGRTFYFCCAGCRDRFIGSPESFAAAVEAGEDGGVRGLGRGKRPRNRTAAQPDPPRLEPTRF